MTIAFTKRKVSKIFQRGWGGGGGLEWPIGKDRQDALESLIQPSVPLSLRK
jgi:hypothetical protein